MSNPELKREWRIGASSGMGDTYYSAILLVNGLLHRNGEYGKVIRLSDEIIADMDKELNHADATSDSKQVALRVKSRALTSKGSCEKNLGHPDEAERFYLEAIDLMMDGVTHPKDYWVIDALFVAVLETTEFFTYYNLYLGSGNNIYYPTLEGYTVKSCRAYFQLKNGLTASELANGVKAFRLNFGDETTNIEEIVNSKSSNSKFLGAWYDMSGRQLQDKPTQRGVYVNNGRKIVIK